MRSIKGFVLSLVFSLAAVAAAGSVTAGAAAYLKGDVDNSGIIDYIDVSLVNSYISRDITLGGSITGAGSQVWLADFDGSGDINMLDIEGMLNYIANGPAKPEPETVFTSTEDKPSYLMLTEDYGGLNKTRQLDPSYNHGILFDNLYYGYRIDENNYRLYYKNTYVTVPKDKVRDGVFVSNSNNTILKIGTVSQFDSAMNDTRYNGKEQDLSCGPACVLMAAISELGNSTLTITQIFADGRAYANSLGMYENDVFAHCYSTHQYGYLWCVEGYTGTTLPGMYKLLNIYAQRAGKTVVSPTVNYLEANNTTIDKIDKALSEGHVVLAAVQFNSRYVNFNGYSSSVTDCANFNPYSPYIHYVVIAGECDGSGKYDGCYAIADPYKKVLYDVYGNLVCNDINSGVTVIKKQDMARSINGVSGSWYRGIVYIN